MTDSGGGGVVTEAPVRSSFRGKLAKILGRHPHLGVGAPALGNPGSATALFPRLRAHPGLPVRALFRHSDFMLCTSNALVGMTILLHHIHCHGNQHSTRRKNLTWGLFNFKTETNAKYELRSKVTVFLLQLFVLQRC